MKKKMKKKKKGERESTPARFTVGDRARAIGSRVARDGTAARKKREGYGRRKKKVLQIDEWFRG